MKKLIRLFMVLLAAGGLLTAVFTTFSTATARPAPRTLQQTSFGNYTIDGDLSEWTARQRIDLPSFSSEFQRRVGYALYGTFVDGHYLIAVQSAVPIGPNTTIWLNTDQNPATGYLVFGNSVGASGAEFNINFDASTVPALYSGGAGATLVNSSLPYGLGAGNTLLEIAIPASLIGGSPPLADIDIFLDINDVVYLPRAYFGGEPYTILRQPLPEPANTGEQRIAIVYSDVSAKNWYSERDYTQLYASVQHQAMMSGLPYDLIHDTELLTLTNILRYDALILPFNPNIALANLPRVQQNLLRAVHNYGIGLISSSNFLTNDENDNALLDNYARLRLLFGLDPNAYGGPISATLKADDVSHPVMREYGPGDVVHHYLNENGPQTHFYALFVPETTGTIALSSASLVSLTNHINSSVNTAVWATETGARNVHFGTPQYMGDRNLLWQAIQWVVYGDELAPVNLKLGRQTNLFVSRNDMDQSQFIMEQQFLGSAGVTNKLYHDFLVDWKQRYNFVGSYYLNIGYDFTSPTDSRCYSGNTAGSVDRLTFGRGNDQEGLACTRWLNDNGLSTEPGIVITYTLYLSDGNEIGSHSYTHLPPITGTIPNPIGLYTDTNRNGVVDIDDLTPAERLFEFQGSIDVIENELGIDVTGAAGPGNPESLPTALELDAGGYMEYFSGGYSSIGAGFPSVFGRLTPDFDMIYMAPNMTFDFAMIGFWGLTPAEAEIRWQEEYMDLNEWAKQPILHWPWHDYALGSIYESQNYTTTMFTSLLQMAYDDGAEFITADDLQRRIRAYEATQLYLTPRVDGFTTEIVGSGLGRSSLELTPGSGNVIASVDGWYAYNDDHIFLPHNGGTFTAHFAPNPLTVTRIVTLPMRADLQSVTGNGADLRYTFHGEGSVFVEVNIPTGATMVVSPTLPHTLTGTTLEMYFGTIGNHTAEVYFPIPNLILDKQATPSEVIPGRTITYTFTVTNDGRADATGVVLSDTLSPWLSNITAVDTSDINTPLNNIGTPPAYQWSLADIPAGSSREIRVTAVLSTQTPSNLSFSNSAEVSTFETERTLTDNRASSTAVHVSNTTRCGITDDTDYSFNADSPVTMHITDTGSMDCLSVTPVVDNHPGAYNLGLQANDRWFQLSALDTSGNDASGTFSLTLTLPTSFVPTAQDKLCRYVGVGGPNGHIWDCAANEHTSNSITRHGVDQFSDWVPADNVGPTAVVLFGLNIPLTTPTLAPLLIPFTLLLLLTLTTWLWQRRTLLAPQRISRK